MSQARHVGKIVVRARTLQQQQGVDKVGGWVAARSAAQSKPQLELPLRTPVSQQSCQQPAAHALGLPGLQGAVVVTGGLGMIGSLVASWLARQQVPHVVLLGRSGRPGAVSGAVVQLAAHGNGSAAAFHMLRCDAASAEEVAAVAAAVTRGRKLQGVVHSGGMLADAAIPNQTLSGIWAAFAPKASSAQLWQLPVGLQASAMHLTFSSVAALLGSPGQANYSAANAALDAMALSWQAQVGWVHSQHAGNAAAPVMRAWMHCP
jgi:NAD(P)-dependent dehydrogenase (short-subunit alcohol dehydrogenase family)